MKGRAPVLGAVAAVVAVALVPSPATGSGSPPAVGPGCDPFAIGLPAISSARLSEDAAAAGIVEPNVAEAYAEALERRRAPATRRARASGPVHVPVYIHVIQDSAGAGVVPPSQITSQMTVLNDGFGGRTGGNDTGFVFDLVDTDVTINPAWSPLQPDTPEELAAKTALREGGVRALNLYIVELTGLLGYATPPYGGSATNKRDGVVVKTASLPGGTPPFDEGDTATHEVGHWLGLFHTFDGGCGPPGDLVDDTEPEATEHFGCGPSDSCPGGGNDPLDNFMSYADDACMHVFTAGQGNRMHDQTAAFRNAAPATANQVISTSGEAVAVNIAGTDADGDAISYAVSDPPDHGIIGGSAGALTYTPASGYGGPDSFAVRVTDIFGAGATSTVSVDVISPSPDLKTEAKAKQKLAKLAVTASCGTGGCELTAGGKIAASGPGGNRIALAAKTFKLKAASATAPANGSATLKLKLAKAKQRQLLALLEEGWKAKATVTVSATSSGGESRRTATIAVKP
jgi:hypothetical protein